MGVNIALKGLFFPSLSSSAATTWPLQVLPTERTRVPSFCALFCDLIYISPAIQHLVAMGTAYCLVCYWGNIHSLTNWLPFAFLLALLHKIVCLEQWRSNVIQRTSTGIKNYKARL